MLLCLTHGRSSRRQSVGGRAWHRCFFYLTDRYASLDAKKDPLLELDAMVPWEEFRPLLTSIWRKLAQDRKLRAGRKPWGAIVMFKKLVLCALYNQSDDQTEY